MLDLIGTIEAAELPDGQLLVSAHGPLDERVVGLLRDALVPIAAADDVVVLLDLGDAHGIDDAALDVVGRAAHLVCRRGERLRVITRSPFVLQLVEESGLSDVVSVWPTLRQAIEG